MNKRQDSDKQADNPHRCSSMALCPLAYDHQANPNRQGNIWCHNVECHYCSMWPNSVVDCKFAAYLVSRFSFDFRKRHLSAAISRLNTNISSSGKRGGAASTLHPRKISVQREFNPVARPGAAEVCDVKFTLRMLTTYFPGRKITSVLGHFRGFSEAGPSIV